MEIPSVVASEGHSASGSFGAQELNPKIPALSEKEDHRAQDVPLQEQSSPLWNDEEVHNRSIVFACQENTKSSQEAEPVSLSLDESFVEVRPPLSAELQYEDIMSHDCDVALPSSSLNGRSDNVEQNTAGHISSCEPKGCVCSLESSPTITAYPNRPDLAQNSLPVPRIVKYNQSSITFLDNSDTKDHSFSNCEGSENGEEQKGGQFYHADDNDGYDDDVFNDVSGREELLVNNRSIHRKMRDVGSLKVTIHCGFEAEEEVCCFLL